jgi:lipid II:glycine glycyltransferase (peptidoglycan interpeptide bridge formation enzyme)
MAQGTKRKNWDVLRSKLEETKQSESKTNNRSSKKRRRHTELSDALKSTEEEGSGQPAEVVIPGHHFLCLSSLTCHQ